jgi:hypothetical protein
MVISAAQPQMKDYFIVGPSLKPDNGVMEAIFSLYYLPQNYKLILPATLADNETFYDEVVSLVKANALEERVYFSKDTGSMKSPEAFASAVLNTARSGYCM